MIRVLGFCASPRVGNSLFLLNQALEAVKARAAELGEEVEIDTCTIRAKKLAGCVMCQGCMQDGICRIKDDFGELQEKWLKADVIIYSVPVYHMGVPAQLKATEYAEAVARACPRRPLRIGGHSKGGNLAAWAAVHLDEKLQRKRLIAAYNNDGPGFSRDLVNEPCYQAVADRLFTFIPASSIVGVLLEHAEDYEVVDSTARSIMQHEPLSWCVEGPHFVHLGQRSQLGQLSDGVLREWIGSMTPQEREQFSRAFFDILSRGGRTKTLEELRSGGLAAGAALLREYAGADEEKKKIITEIFRRLAVDVKDELVKAAGASVRRAGESILATGQAIADLRK